MYQLEFWLFLIFLQLIKIVHIDLLIDKCELGLVVFNIFVIKSLKKGQTGFPWIDACMRQLLYEGWIHHVCRNSVAVFLTRGVLYLSWEQGHITFLRNLIDVYIYSLFIIICSINKNILIFYPF